MTSLALTSDVDWVNDPPERLRASYDADRLPLWSTRPDGVDLTEDGEDLILTPEDPRGDVLYFHGGGWVVGSPETHRTLGAWLAHCSGMRVRLARYRLAPEARWPAQRKDAAAALRHAPDGVIVAGDSAGAAMAFWADACVPGKAAAVVGLYGAYGLGPRTAELMRYYDDLGIGPEENLGAISRDGCPVLLLKAGDDPIGPETPALSRHLTRPCEVIEVPEAQHGFLHRAGTDPLARLAMDAVGRWLRQLSASSTSEASGSATNPQSISSSGSRM